MHIPGLHKLFLFPSWNIFVCIHVRLFNWRKLELSLLYSRAALKSQLQFLSRDEAVRVLRKVKE